MRLQTIVLAAAWVLILANPAFAEEGGAMDLSTLSAALGIGLAAFGGALSQGRIIGSAVEAIARNPGASGEIKGAWFLGLVFVESLVVYALLIALKLAKFF